MAFWKEQAERLTWEKPFTEVLDWSDKPHAKWFADGTLNVAVNCVDRHVDAGLGDRVAIHWEGEPGDSRSITYAELKSEVCKAANALISLGLQTGDRVAIYLPMIPEAVFSMLACARLGLPHTVIFGGFSAEAIRSRVADSEAKLIITADGQYRRGQAVSLKEAVDAAADTPDSTVQNVLVVSGPAIEVTLARPRRLVARTGRQPVRPAHRRGIRRRDTRCSCSTRPARRASRRASCTPRAAT